MLELMSLNAGRLLQDRTVAFLKALHTDPNLPDVVCIQDLPYRALPLLEPWPHVTFAPMTNHLINGTRGVVGIAIASRHFMTNVKHYTTWGDGILKDLKGINDRNQRHLGVESDRLVEATEDRVLVCAKVKKDGKEFDIATTHGMWVRDGKINNVQIISTGKLIGSLRYEGYARNGLVLAADMNMSRGSKIYQIVTEVLNDCMPADVETTLDPEHGYAKSGGKVVTDYIMTHPAPRRDTYRVSNVRLVPGASDHQVLFATISRD